MLFLHAIHIMMLLIQFNQFNYGVPDSFRIGYLAENKPLRRAGGLHVDIAIFKDKLKKSLKLAGYVLNLE